VTHSSIETLSSTRNRSKAMLLPPFTGKSGEVFLSSILKKERQKAGKASYPALSQILLQERAKMTVNSAY